MSAILVDTAGRFGSCSLLLCSARVQRQGFLVSTIQVERDAAIYCPRCEANHTEVIDLPTAVERGIVAADEDTELLVLDLRELIAAQMRAAA